MKNILISFVGTGPFDKKDVHREYRKAKYLFDNGHKVTTSFFGFAVKKNYDIDRTILVGTPKSMWEYIYETLCEEHNIEVDLDIYLALAKYTDSANHQTDPTHNPLPHQKLLEELLGRKSSIILVKYGINHEEIQFNMERILQIESLLEQHDKVIMDVTHSFRSLPLFLMNTIHFIKQVSNKQISIEHIFYGMLEVTREMPQEEDQVKPTPVVDLKTVLDVQDWITGAHSFKEYGNGYKIADLIEDENTELANLLRKLSDTKNINYLYGLKGEVQKVRRNIDMDMSTIPNRVVRPVLKDFLKAFPNNEMSNAQFQLHLADWHYKMKNYSSSFIVFSEAMLSFACEFSGLDSADFHVREARKKDYFELDAMDEIKKIYTRTKKVRNQIAHNLDGGREIQRMIQNLGTDLKTVKAHMHKCYDGNIPKREYLQPLPAFLPKR